jgi:hypothetical protein
MLFYDKVVRLNRERHRKLRLRSAESKADFARGTHFVPLAGSEFYQAARDFPILFASDEAGSPIALLGLRENENLFVEKDGAWLEGVYVPAFVRRYPFILARGENKEKFIVCIDEKFAGFGEEEGNLLFDQDGKDTALLARTVEFLNNYAADMEFTQFFVKRLLELELLVARSLRITDSKARNFILNDFRVIDEEKLAKLDDATLGELHRKGWLNWIHAHLISLGNINRLPVRVVDDKTDKSKEKVQVRSKGKNKSTDAAAAASADPD